jgi:hypothetical protein
MHKLPAIITDGEYDKSVVWFEYKLGEKEFYKGFVCDAHRFNCKGDKLSSPQLAKAVDEVKSSRIITVSISATSELQHKQKIEHGRSAKAVNSGDC